MKYYLRNPVAVAVGSVDRCVFLGYEDSVTVTGPEAMVAQEVFWFLTAPYSAKAIRDYLGPVAAMVDWLVEHGIVIEGDLEALEAIQAECVPQVISSSCGHLLVGITGAIQASNMIPYLDHLCQFSNELKIVMTEAALRFVSRQALEYLYGLDPWVEWFRTRGDVTVPHIQLARWADLVVILPSSAHTLFRLASGACSDLLSLVVTATMAPVVVCPAMNSQMWAHPAVQRNVWRLRKDGVYVMEPGYGEEVAPGGDQEPMVGAVGATPDRLLAVLEAILEASV